AAIYEGLPWDLVRRLEQTHALPTSEDLAWSIFDQLGDGTELRKGGGPCRDLHGSPAEVDDFRFDCDGDDLDPWGEKLHNDP
ncbi:MAG: hypothetical protein MUO50_04180, partial [Longimicrobiales bacterium]|nr:hypothetical protein [Longimicrobiales bacterium]